MTVIKKFVVNQREYSVNAHSDGEIYFTYDVPVHKDFSTSTEETVSEGFETTNPVKVIRSVVSSVSDWVKKTSPHTFYFEANSDKKDRIYSLLVERFKGMFPDYQHVSMNGFHYFYKM